MIMYFVVPLVQYYVATGARTFAVELRAVRRPQGLREARSKPARLEVSRVGPRTTLDRDNKLPR